MKYYFEKLNEDKKHAKLPSCKELKVGEEESIIRQSMQEREISPPGRNFNHGLGKPRPWLKLLSSGVISISCRDIHNGFLSPAFPSEPSVSVLRRLGSLASNSV